MSEPVKAVPHFVEDGDRRLRLFLAAHREHLGEIRKGATVLDFGCGAGKFVLAGRRKGFKMIGVEVDAEREAQFLANCEIFDRQAAETLRMYDGRLLPIESKTVDAVYSFFVFEHVTDPQTSLREIVRVLRPGGTLTVYADDVRNAWDGHARAPWPPYLPREFAAGYLRGLGLEQHANFVTNWVVYISAVAISDILATLGMEVVYATSLQDRDRMHEAVYVTSEAEAFAFGQRVAQQPFPASPLENLTVIARKPPEQIGHMTRDEIHRIGGRHGGQPSPRPKSLRSSVLTAARALKRILLRFLPARLI